MATGTKPLKAPEFGGRSTSTSNNNYSFLIQIVRVASLVPYFVLAAISIVATQTVGFLLLLISPKDLRVWMDYTKQSFGLAIISITQWYSPSKVNIYSDPSMSNVFSVDLNHNLISNFPHHSIIIANHQIYSDWIYLWWITYSAKLHGSIFIILKDSLKKIPILGYGMKNYNFIFLSRNWKKDETTMDKHLTELNDENKLFSSSIVIFPEGTNLSENTKNKNKVWSDKMNLKETKNLLLPRSTGLRKIITKLSDTNDYLYDCTIGYNGYSSNEFGQDVYSLKNVYLKGNYPTEISMYWRCFKISEIPYDDPIVFDEWLRNIWYEKDKLLELFYNTGSFYDNTNDNTNVINNEPENKIISKCQA